LIALGVLLFSVSMWMMGHLTSAAGVSDVRSALLIRGFGLGLLFVPINSAAYSSVKPTEAQQAAGLINLSRQLGGAFGIAVLANQVAKLTQVYRVDLAADVTAGSVLTDERVQLLTRGFLARGMDVEHARQSAYSVLNGQIQQQASMLSFNDAWMFVLTVFVLVSPSILLLRRPRRAMAPPTDAH
jgi:DHA2 family multidrug resistance protein